MSEVNERIHRYWLILAAIAAVVLAVAVALGVRLRALDRAAAQTRSRPPPGKSPEGTSRRARRSTARPSSSRLAREFNDMVAKLDALLRSQEQFVADASHQLRTPLTALRLRLENLARDADATRERRTRAGASTRSSG